MNCIFCDGELKESTTADLIEYEGFLVVVKNVPCDQCTQCGEGYFSTEIMYQLEEIQKQLEGNITEDCFMDFWQLPPLSS